MSGEEIWSAKTIIDGQISIHVANAVGILALVLLGIPLGIKTRRGDTSLNAALALFLCLGYYFVMVLLSWFYGNDAHVRPDLLVWIPNVALTAIGIFLFRRAARH
jgi:lipopolysaccharide export LptBFGC system permease protein LptF